MTIVAIVILSVALLISVVWNQVQSEEKDRLMRTIDELKRKSQ
jgi:hypothetical protein